MSSEWEDPGRASEQLAGCDGKRLREDKTRGREEKTERKTRGERVKGRNNASNKPWKGSCYNRQWSLKVHTTGKILLNITSIVKCCQ